MIRSFRFVVGRTILKGLTIVYGMSIVAEFVLAYNNVTSQSNPILYPLLTLITGAMGVTFALHAVGNTRISFLFALGIGIWLVGGISMFVAAQTVTDWLESSVFVAASVILGRLLLGTRGASPTLDLSLRGIIYARNSGLLGYRAGKTMF